MKKNIVLTLLLLCVVSLSAQNWEPLFNFFHPFRFFPLKRGSQFCAPNEAAQNKSKVNTIFFMIIY